MTNRSKLNQTLDAVQKDQEAKQISDFIQSLGESIEFFEVTLIKNRSDLDVLTIQSYQEHLNDLKDKLQKLKIIGNEFRIKKM